MMIIYINLIEFFRRVFFFFVYNFYSYFIFVIKMMMRFFYREGGFWIKVEFMVVFIIINKGEDVV